MIDQKALGIFKDTIDDYNKRWSTLVEAPEFEVLEYRGNGDTRRLVVETVGPKAWHCEAKAVKKAGDGLIAKMAGAVWLNSEVPRPC